MYKALKQCLIRAYGLTDFQRAEKLHAINGLGGRTPSELMDYMLSINGTNDSKNYLFACLFLKNLPPPIRRHVSRLPWSDVYDLAEEAGKIFLCDPNTYASPIEALQDGSSEDENVLYKVSHAPRARPREGQSPKRRPREPAQELCYYHQTFGRNARRCRSPCT